MAEKRCTCAARSAAECICGAWDRPSLTAADARVLRELLACCRAWEPDVCVMGNVRAGDAARAIERAVGVKGAPDA